MAGCPKYEMLCTIFDSSVATGILHRASTDLAPDSDEERHLEAGMHNRGNIGKQPIDIDIDEMLSRARNKGKQPVSFIDVEEMDVSKQYKKHISASYTRPTHRRNQGGYLIELFEELGSALQEMTKSAAARTKQYEDDMLDSRFGKRSKGNEIELDERYGLHQQCMNYLEEIEPSLDSDQFVKVFDRLCNPNMQKIFMALKPE